MSENHIRASVRTKSKEAPNPIINHGLESPLHEYWTLHDFSEWTGVGAKQIVQALVFGICRERSAITIARILEQGGLTVRKGKKEPLP